MAALSRRKEAHRKSERPRSMVAGANAPGGGLEFKAERFIGVKRGRWLNEDVGEVGKDTPVPLFIGHCHVLRAVGWWMT
jgi:hypothetical protein